MQEKRSLMFRLVCFIPLKLAGSLGRCLNTRPNSLMFKQNNICITQNLFDIDILISPVCSHQTSSVHHLCIGCIGSEHMVVK